jgi:hypothetical protein
MNPQKLLILVLLMAAAVGGLIYVNAQPATEVEEVDPYKEEMRALNRSAVANQKPVIFQGDATQLKSITLHRAIDFSMTKLVPTKEGIWFLQEPYQDRAESNIAQILANLLFDTEALPSPDDWRGHTDADLGLAQPQYDIEVLYLDGSEERMQIGAQVPNSTHRFAHLDGELIQIPSQILELSKREPLHWRDHSLVQWPQLSRRVEWRPKNGDGWVIQRNDNQWHLLEPIQSAVDPLRVQTLMRLLGSRASSLPQSRGQSDEVEAFLQNAGELLVARNATESQADDQSFWIKDNFAYDPNRGYFMALGVDDIRFLQLEVDAMRSRRLVAFDPNHISSLRLIMEGEEHILMRGSSGWKNAEGKLLTKAASNKLTTLLRYLSILETTELVKPEPSANINSILLSTARKPVMRGSVQLRYSVLADGRSSVSTLESRQNYVADRNLTEEWRKVLVFVD